MTTSPERLYKYRAFSHRTLEQLIDDMLFYADPSSFNDPLDTRPSLDPDLDDEELLVVLKRLSEQRRQAELKSAAKSLDYHGRRTLRHISEYSNASAHQIVSDARLMAEHLRDEFDQPLKDTIAEFLTEELLRRFNKGIVSLAEKFDCPLMWSHYGDQHRGVCVGYGVPESAEISLHRISYRAGRKVKASSVKAMLDGNEKARLEVDRAVFARKARSWQYEKEWRLVGMRGLRSSPLKMEDVTFGMRCPEPVKFAIVTSLESRREKLKFYDIQERSGDFNLCRVELDKDDLLRDRPRVVRDTRSFFGAIIDIAGGRSSHDE